MSVIEHAVRASLPSKLRTYRLEADALSWADEGVSGRIRYADVASVRLLRQPNMGDDVRQCIVRSRDGAKVTVGALHYVSLANFEDRTATYVPFVQDLTRRVAAANPAAEFVMGSSVMWYVWLVLLVLLGLTGLALVLAMLGGASISFNAIWPIVLVFGLMPGIWRFMKRGRRTTFDPSAPPMDLIGA